MKPTYTYDEIAFHLTDTGQAFFGEERQFFNVPASGTLTYNLSQLNRAGQIFADAAIDAWEAVSGITFVATTGAADIGFNDAPSGLEAYAETNIDANGYIANAEVTISKSWIEDDWYRDRFGQTIVRYDSYSMQTYIHEIGHVLGLAHAGDYNSSATYATDAIYTNDSWQATIMSYFAQDENPTIDADFAYIMTPMIADIIAIQDLYRLRPDTLPDDTTYGLNGNTGTYLDDLIDAGNAIAFTIYDSAGDDTVNFASVRADQTIDLNAEAISSVGGLRGNMSIARFVTIENAKSGAGDDALTGNEVANLLNGGAGQDTLAGQAGDDFLNGGLGNDAIHGDAGDDTLLAFAGANSMLGGDDDDLLLGGFEADSLFGGAGQDILRGDVGRGFFAGSDLLDGGSGDDVLMGAGGADTFVFRPNDGQDVIGHFTMAEATAGVFVAFGNDFVAGQDMIRLEGFSGLNAVNVMSIVTQSQADSVFSTQGAQITIIGTANSLTADDFIFA